MTGITIKPLGGEGADVVLIHGFAADRLSWLGTSPALMERARVHALDLPGHGDATGVPMVDASPAGIAGQVADALRESGIGRTHLVGHSLGAALAMLMALSEPQRVASLTLIAPPGLGGGIDHDFLARYPELEGPEEVTALLQRLVFRPKLINRYTVQRVIEQLAKPGAREALRRISAGLAEHEAGLAEAARQISLTEMPRLLIFGTEDRINPPDMAGIDYFGRERLLIQGAGHLPHIEAAREVNSAIADFLARAGQ